MKRALQGLIPKPHHVEPKEAKGGYTDKSEVSKERGESSNEGKESDLGQALLISLL